MHIEPRERLRQLRELASSTSANTGVALDYMDYAHSFCAQVHKDEQKSKILSTAGVAAGTMVAGFAGAVAVTAAAPVVVGATLAATTAMVGKMFYHAWRTNQEHPLEKVAAQYGQYSAEAKRAAVVQDLKSDAGFWGRLMDKVNVFGNDINSKADRILSMATQGRHEPESKMTLPTPSPFGSSARMAR